MKLVMVAMTIQTIRVIIILKKQVKSLENSVGVVIIFINPFPIL